MNRLTRAALRTILGDLEAAMAESDANEPHAVLITDPATGGQSITGPFPNLDSAITAIDRLRERWQRDHEPPMGVFTAIPFTPVDHDLLAQQGDEGERP